MQLATKLRIKNPRALLLAFVQHWYPMYDGVEVPQDNQLRVVEIALSTMLNSRISGNTAGDTWRGRRSVEAALAGIPTGLDVLDVPAGDEIPGAAGIARAITELCTVRWVKLSVSTKILHKKRPGLIPIFDRVVESHYCPRGCLSVPHQSWGDYALALTAVVHRDMLSVASELRDLRAELQQRRTPMTACRILNVLTWAVKSDNANWLLNKARTKQRVGAL
jgi:hypothetical protein